MDGRVNVGLAVTAIVLILVTTITSTVVMAMAGMRTFNGMTTGINMLSLISFSLGVYIFVLILGVITAILQFVVLKQIMNVLNNNINHTRALLANIQTDDLSIKSEIEAAAKELESERVPGWAFWGYVVSYIIAFVFLFVPPMTSIFGLVGFVLYLIYLYQIFSTSASIYQVKNRVYSYLRNMKKLPQVEELRPITKRNIFLVLVLTIVTFGVYWLYLLVKLPTEVNEFVKSDEKIRVRFAS